MSALLTLFFSSGMDVLPSPLEVTLEYEYHHHAHRDQVMNRKHIKLGKLKVKEDTKG